MQRNDVPKDWSTNAARPAKFETELPETESAETYCDRVYSDVPVAKPVGNQCTIGGRSLIVAADVDANRVAGWKGGVPNFTIYNARALHFKHSIPRGSLPEAMESGTLILLEAWIQGEYKGERLPHESEPLPEDDKPITKISLPEKPSMPPSPPSKTKKQKRRRRMVWPEKNLPDEDKNGWN